MAELQWNVYYHEFNADKITILNIFNHGGFADDVKKALKKFNSKDEFAEELRRDLFYYFGSKCEYEVIISPWVTCRENAEIKVDIYNQVRLNWDVFLDYVWSHKAGSNGRGKSEVKTGYCPICNHHLALHIEDLSDGALE